MAAKKKVVKKKTVKKKKLYPNIKESLTEIIKYEKLKNDYKLLYETFEKLLVDQFALSELRDFWRKRAGAPTKLKSEKI